MHTAAEDKLAAGFLYVFSLAVIASSKWMEIWQSQGLCHDGEFAFDKVNVK